MNAKRQAAQERVALKKAERERAERERHQHNAGLEREAYTRVLSHADYHYNRLRRKRINEIMKAADGRRVLELGSRSWDGFIVEFGIKPAAITCINISEKDLEEGRRRARDAGQPIDFRLMDAQNLDFPDASFDVIFGEAILHHLQFSRTLREIRRVLAPDGIAVFTEPLDNNPVGRIVRALTPNARTVDEEPLRFQHLRQFRELFELETYFEQFLSVPAGVLSYLCQAQENNVLTRSAFAADEWLLKRLPALGPFYRHAMFVCRRPSETPAARAG